MFEHKISQERLPALERQIIELGRKEEAVARDMTLLIEEFDRLKGYERWGLSGTPAWLEAHLGLAPESARERVRVARATRTLPKIAAAMRAGVLCYGRARAITRIATRETEAFWLARAKTVGSGRLEREVRAARIRAIAEDPALQAAERRCTVRTLPSGMERVEADLPATDAAVLRKALELAGRDVDVSQETDADLRGSPIPARRRADALTSLARCYLSGGTGSTPSRQQDRFHIVIALDEQSKTARFPSGVQVADSTLERLILEAKLSLLLKPAREEETIRELRGVSRRMRREILRRDRICQYPGCRNASYLEAHHRVFVSRGGRHVRSNLIALCTFHHDVIHKPGYTLGIEGGRVFVITPAGKLWSDRPIPSEQEARELAVSGG